MAIIKNPLTIVQANGGENKLPDVLNKTVTTLTAEDLIGTTQNEEEHKNYLLYFI